MGPGTDPGKLTATRESASTHREDDRDDRDDSGRTEAPSEH
jgi:hypothetical protein